jgi:predicted ATPase
VGAADLERFRQKLREYRLLVNRSQGDLAAYLNLDYSELSNRLNAHKNAHLSHDNVRTLVRALADWGAITTRSQAEELLDLMLCPHFDPADWQARPLSKLTALKVLAPALSSSSVPVSTLHNTPVKESRVSTDTAQEPTFRPRPSHNLPHNLNPLLGRARELAQIADLLAKPATRLLTLTGAGGSGKTSLAFEAGKELLPAFSEGVYLVRLEDVTRRESLLDRLAGTLKVYQTAGNDLLQSLKENLKEKKFLLILDNFEQLVSEAGVLSELLHETDYLKLLVTSRIPLHLSFEHEYPVGPLALPDKEALARQRPGELEGSYSGVGLFVARAGAVKPDFALSQENVGAVVEICRRLDGLPLALELAAARVRTFSPEKLLERLSLKVLTGGARDLPARQKTLWDTIAWSYDLLRKDEQRLFTRLAIFVGGCTLEAAEAVCNPAGELELDVFEGIEALLTRNLLKQWEGPDGQTRYGMLVTIREFGLEKLAKSGEFEVVERRFAAYYQTLSRQLDRRMAGADGQKEKELWKVESEYLNYRAVLYQAIEGGKAEEALELSAALGDYFQARGYFSEGLSFLEQSLALPYSADSSEARTLRAWALFWTGVQLNDYERSHPYYEQALALYRELNDTRGIIFALNRVSEYHMTQGDYAASDRCLAESLALCLELNNEGALENTRAHLVMTAGRQGKYEEARRYAEESLVMFRASGNRAGQAIALGFLGGSNFHQGKYNEARRYLEQSLALHREIGIIWGLILSMNFLGLVAVGQGEYPQALVYAREGLSISREVGFKAGKALSMYVLGTISLCQGDYPQARANLEESLPLYRAWGDKLNLPMVLPFLGLTVAKQGKVAEAHRYYAESLLLSRKLGNNLFLAHSLTGLAGLWVQLELAPEAPGAAHPSNYFYKIVCLSGATSALLASCGAVMFRPFPQLYEQNLAVARTNLDKATFEAAFAEGQAMSIDEVAAYALSE